MVLQPGNRRSGNPVGNWIGIILLIVILIGLFFVLRGIFNLLYLIAPILLIATLIIDYKVVLDYIKQLGQLFTRNPLYGLGAAAFTFFLYPIVFVILLTRAWTGKRMSNFSFGGKSDEEFADYEEVDELDLGELEELKEKRYDDLKRNQ